MKIAVSHTPELAQIDRQPASPAAILIMAIFSTICLLMQKGPVTVDFEGMAFAKMDLRRAILRTLIT
jgi:hypothetical protein